MSKCLGCGIDLQSEDEKELGFTPKKDSKYCQRCFKLKNYHENNNLAKIMPDEVLAEKINKQNIFTFFLTDPLNLNKKVISLYKKINSLKVLVITKIDILPKNLKYEIFLNNIKKIYDIKDVLLFSSVNGYGKNNILKICQREKEVMFSGITSSGKSSLINYLFNEDLTTSEMKNTTQDFIKIKKDNFTLYDAPGFNEIYPIKEISLKGSINPKIIHLKKDFSLNINNIIIKTNSNFTLYLPKNILIKTKKDGNTYEKIVIPTGSDLVIPSLGFLYFKEKTVLESNIKDYEIRESVVRNHE